MTKYLKQIYFIYVSKNEGVNIIPFTENRIFVTLDLPHLKPFFTMSLTKD